MRGKYNWVRSRLYAWGCWRCLDVVGLGYPSMTPEARLKDSPGRCTKPSNGPDYQLPTDEIRETDAIIMAMESALNVALWCRYVQQIEPRRAAVACGVNGSEAYWSLVEKAERALCRAIRKIP